MHRRKNASIGLLMILVLASALVPAPASANDGGEARPVRLFATASTGPIGTIAGGALSSAGLAINGRVVSGDRPVWAGDLLQSRSNSNISVVLDEIGRVTLAKGAVVRLSTANAANGDAVRHMLVASLVSGDITVRLDPGATAYVRACGSIFTSSQGASFRVSADHGEAKIDASEGNVKGEATSAVQRKYTFRPIGHGDEIRVRTGGSQYIRLQVLDENNRPVAEMPVIFSLAPGAGRALGALGLGTLAGPSYTTLTNADGIAAVPFVAGQNKGTTAVTAVIEETGVTWSGQITVTGGANTGRNALIVAGVAAAIGAGFAIYKLTDDKDDIVVLPPESIP